MALTDLLSAIDAEAQAEAEAIVDEARLEAGRLLEQARGQAIDAEAAPARRQEPGLQAEARRSLATARAAGDVQRRSAREEAFAQAVERLEQRLGGIRDRPEWPRALQRLTDEAVAALPDGALAAVHADLRDAPLVAAHLARVGVGAGVVGDLTTHGGVVAVTADGRRADNTLEGRLVTADPVLRRRFAERIAGRP